MAETTNETPTDEASEMPKAERLRKLYDLSQKIKESTLGKDKHTKRKLWKLRDRVIAEIRELEAEREEARQRYFAEVRKKMKEVGFVPSGDTDE